MRGEVVFHYAFDVAGEIRTVKIREVLSEKPVPFEIPQERTLPKDVPIYRPLTIQPSDVTGTIGGKKVRATVRIYDVGVVNISFRVAFDVTKLAELMVFHNPRLDDGRPLDQLAAALCHRVTSSIRQLMIDYAMPAEPEAYTIFCWTDPPHGFDSAEWMNIHRREVAGLLSETNPDLLSDGQVVEVLRVQRSFERSDIVVIDWDAAFVVDSTGYIDDVLYVLELANLQLEEFKVIDAKLDRYLDTAYDDLGRRPKIPIFGTPVGTIRTIRRVRVDVAKLADEVTHITKFFGDWYLARLYLGARDRFYLDQWRKSVEDRLSQLDSLYGVVYSELNERRMLWLEIIIVILFVADLAALFFFK